MRMPDEPLTPAGDAAERELAGLGAAGQPVPVCQPQALLPRELVVELRELVEPVGGAGEHLESQPVIALGASDMPPAGLIELREDRLRAWGEIGLQRVHRLLGRRPRPVGPAIRYA